MDLEPTRENLSEAFGFQVPESLERLVRLALRLNAESPCRALEPLGVRLGGPLFPFLGGPPNSLRAPHTPPELFPFLMRAGQDVQVGYVMDAPEQGTGEECLLGALSL